MVYRELQKPATQVASPLRQPVGVLQRDPTRVAVLLNRNARRVTDKLARDMEAIVGRGNLYYSRNLEEAEAYAREIVQQGYGTVVCGGGDGTLMRGYNFVARYVDESNAWRQERNRRFAEQQERLAVPRFAFVALGTGNGLRKVVGAQDPLTDLRTIVEEGPQGVHEVSLIARGQERFTFGGIGYDSMLLNDYNWLKKHAENRLLKPLVQTVAGYFGAVFTRTLPRVLAKRVSFEGRVRSVGPAYYLDPRRGDTAVAIAPGTVLHEGPFTMVGVGTTPFFGYGMRVFPFAGVERDMMHLRIARLGALGTLGNLPSIWRGTYRNSSKMLDFLVKDVVVELARPMPFQQSGDDQGAVNELHLRVADDRLQLVDLYGTRLIAP